MKTKLRILLVADVPWDERLGAARVFIELGESWRAAGHTVLKYCLADAYPVPARNRLISIWRQFFFPRNVARFIRCNADQFDVIDALLGTVPFSKSRLGFHGLLVGRSVGLHRLYEDFDRLARKRWPPRSPGKLLGRVASWAIRKRMFLASERALLHCDLLNLPNELELESLRHDGVDKPAVVQPYGLSDERRRSFAQAARPVDARLAAKTVVFIGMWHPRKGARDWGTVARRVRREIPDVRFLFLGTLVQDRQVLADFDPADHGAIELVAQYLPNELPTLLARATIGAFPSYAEGFGLAVLEQLAAGVPVVAYDSPGPRSILQSQFPDLLVSIGDTEKFAAKLAQLLRADLPTYAALSQRSRELASRFDWQTIADATAESYRAALEFKPLAPPVSANDAEGAAR